MQRNEETTTALAVAPMQLRVRNRRGLDQVIQLEDRITIGASTDCSIRLDDADPVHCFIVNGAVGTVLRKWQGEVRLNEQPVQDAWLKHGDVVRIGDNEIRLLGEATQENEFTSSGNATTDSAATSLRLQTRQLAKNRVAALVQSLRQSRTELASFRDRSNDLRDQISTLKAETATLHQNISAKDATIADLDGQLRDALTHSSTLQKEIDSLRQHVDQTTNDFAQSNKEWVEQAEALLQRLNVPADSWPSIQDRDNAPLAYLTLIASSLQSASEAESQVADDSAQLLTELETRQAEVEQRSQQIDEQVRQIEQQHDELQQIRESLDQSRNELETAQTEFESQKESWEVEQHNLIAQFDSVRAAYEQERSAFDAEKSEADSQLEFEREELRRQVETATEECNELRRKIETLQAEQTEVTATELSFDDSPANEFTESPSTIDEFATTEFAEETPSPANEFVAPTAEPESYAAESDFAEAEFAEPAFQIEEPAANATEFTDHIEPQESDFTSSMDEPENDFVVENSSEHVFDGGSTHDGDDEYLVEGVSQDFSAPETFSDPELNQPEPTVAEPAEEIEFSSVNNEAPIDTASILAKYGVSADMDDDEFAAEMPHAETVQPAAPMPTELETMDGNTDSDSEDNIDEYMAQLLSRVGGASTQPKADAPQTPSTAEDVVNRSIEAIEQESAPVEDELPPLRPEEFVPRSKAPALDMTSMRSIANETARSAINRHAFKKNRNTLLMQWFMVVCLVSAGVILLMFGTLLTQLGAGLTFVLGIYMGLRAAGIITSNRSMGQKLASIKEKKQKKQRKKKLPKK